MNITTLNYQNFCALANPVDGQFRDSSHSHNELQNRKDQLLNGYPIQSSPLPRERDGNGPSTFVRRGPENRPGRSRGRNPWTARPSSGHRMVASRGIRPKHEWEKCQICTLISMLSCSILTITQRLPSIR